ncbi:hypothetical protein V496_05956 [Pseudogymnoascus sp. VKM F-4515 (FW-2607)]|nr:hypothetical protein V496_05956 [Pseudogymnoascus sp. VKM F-4515 (FW-2607)]
MEPIFSVTFISSCSVNYRCDTPPRRHRLSHPEIEDQGSTTRCTALHYAHLVQPSIGSPDPPTPRMLPTRLSYDHS